MPWRSRWRRCRGCYRLAAVLLRGLPVWWRCDAVAACQYLPANAVLLRDLLHRPAMVSGVLPDHALPYACQRPTVAAMPVSDASPCDISPTVSGGRGGDSWGMLSHACQWSRCQPSGHRPAWCGRMPWGFVGMLPHAVLLPACYGVRHGVASPMPASPCHAVPPSGVWSSLPACYGVRRPIAWPPIPLRIPPQRPAFSIQSHKSPFIGAKIPTTCRFPPIVSLAAERKTANSSKFRGCL